MNSRKPGSELVVFLEPGHTSRGQPRVFRAKPGYTVDSKIEPMFSFTALTEGAYDTRGHKGLRPDERGRVGIFAASGWRDHRAGGHPAGAVLRPSLRVRLHPDYRFYCHP